MTGKELRAIKRKENKFLNRRTVPERIAFEIIFIIFAIHSLTLLVPTVWMFMSSFKGRLEYFGEPFALPKVWEFNNYVQAFTMLNVGQTTFVGMIFNSLWYTVLATGVSLIMPSITGYVLSKYNFKCRTLIFSVAVACMVIPIVGATASHMKTIAFFGLYNSPFYVVVTNLGGFGGTFLVYYGFFKSVSWAYAEAAEIDGAGPFMIFFRIMIPQAVPILLTYAITGAIANWNEYNTMILYLPSYPTLASGLFEYQANMVRAADYPVYYAGLIISMIPTIILFSAFSGKIMTSLSIGGLKG